MTHVNSLLICDGASDAALEHPIRWLIQRSRFAGTLSIQTADLSRTPEKPKGLKERLELAIKIYQPDVIFIHRDAERDSWTQRCSEIEQRARELRLSSGGWIPVIPVRMLEAWLLFDESAIRRAADNPNGTVRLNLPSLKRLESLPDPKTELFEAIKTASELKGRRLQKLKPVRKRHIVAEEISDFTPLLKLEAFKRLHDDITSTFDAISEEVVSS